MLTALVAPSACAAPADPDATGAADRPPAPQRAHFPTASSTGVPPGAALKESGSILIDTDGAVIDRLAITGTVTVAADDVTIRRTRITSTAQIPVLVSGANLVIEDTEIDGSGLLGPAVAYSGYSLIRVHVHNVQEASELPGVTSASTTP